MAALVGVVATTALLAPGASQAIPAPAPRLESVSGSTYTNADTLTFNISFDIEVRNVDATDFEVTGSTATITNLVSTGSDARYYQATVAGGDLADLNGLVDLALVAGQDIESLGGVPLTNLATQFPEGTTVNNTRPNCAFTTAASAPVTSTFTVDVTCTPQDGFADVIVGFNSSDLVLSNASLESFSFTSGTYAGSFVLRPLDAGTITVDLPADSLYDDASNTNTASTQFSISSDVTVPTVTMNPWSLSPYSGPLTLGITFSESVTGFDPATDLILSNATVAVLSSGTRSFTITVTPTAQGAFTVDVPAGVAVDTDGFANTASAQFAGVYDTDAPVYTFSSDVVAPAIDNFTLDISVSESVHFQTSYLTVTNGRATNISGSGTDYSVTIRPTANTEGIVTVALEAGAAPDPAGNDNAAATPFSVAYDLKSPQIDIIERLNPVDQVTNADSLTFGLTFTEDVTGLDAGDLRIQSDQSDSQTTASVTQIVARSASRYEVTVSGGNLATIGGNYSTGGSESVSVFAQSSATVLDVAGRALNGTSAQTTQEYYEVDNRQPGLVISGPALGTSDFTVTFTFDEDVTGFSLADVVATNVTLDNLSGSGAVYTADATASGGTPITINVAAGAAQDEAGNTSSAATEFSIAYDETAPTVLSIVRDTPADEYTNASNLTWLVTFSEAVQGVGTADFAVAGTTASVLSVGSVGGNAYEVLVAGGDLSTMAGSVVLSFAPGVSITDVNGLALVDTNPSGANEDTYFVSHAVPVIASLVRQSPTDEYTNADSVTWDLQFSSISALFSLDADDFILTGTTADLAVTRYSIGFYLTASGGDLADADGEVRVRLNSDFYADEYGNELNGDTDPTGANENTFWLDNTAPTALISTDGPGGSSDPFEVTIVFSEVVSGFDAADLQIVNATASDIVETLAGRFFTFTLTPTAEGLVSLDVAAGAAQDGAGNDNVAAETWSEYIDNTAPYVTNVEFVTTGGSPTRSDTLQWAISLSEEVENADGSDFALVNSTASISSVTQPQPTLLVVEASGGDLAGKDGLVTLTVGSLDIADLGGNRLSGLTVTGGADERAVTLDNTGPVASLSYDNFYVAGSFDLDIGFSEPVTGFTGDDLAVTNGTVTALNPDGDGFVATIAPVAAGQIIVSLAADQLTDAAGNGNDQAGPIYLLHDPVAPTLTTIARAYPTDETTSSDSVVWGVDFSETVNNVDASDFRIAGTTAELVVSGVRGDGAEGSGSRASADDRGPGRGSFQYLVTARGGDLPTLNGTVTLSLSGGTDIADSAGTVLANTTPTGTNENTFILENDVIAPTVVLSSAASDPVSGVFTLVVTFSEDVTGFELGDLSIGNGVASNLAGSGAVYTATVTAAADGTVTVDLAADAASDAAGNGNEAASQFSITSDASAPTVVLASAVAGPVAGPFEVTVEFSEDVSGFELSDLGVDNGVASDLTGSGASWSVTVTPSADGDVTIDLAAGSATDDAGNGNVAAASLVIENDQSAPGVVLGSDATEPVVDAFTLTITFDEDVTGFELGDVIVTNAVLSDFAGAGAVYTVVLTPSGGSPVTVDVAADSAVDAAGNGNTAAATYSLVTDNTPPSLEITVPGEETQGVFSAVFTFSEAVTGFAVDDIVVSNGDLSEFAAIDETSWSVTVTPQTLGTITLGVAAGAAEDAAGNGNLAGEASLEAVAEPIEVAVVVAEDVADPTEITATARVTNPGSQAVDFLVQVDVPWLDVDPRTGTIPSLGDLVLTISVNELANGLEAGTYTGTVTVINLSGGGAAAKTPNAHAMASGNTTVVAIPLTVTIAERRGSIQLVSTTPGGVQRDATFDFASSDTDLDAISLTTRGGHAASAPVRKLLGSYDVTQSLPEGWRIDSISCVGDTDNGSVIDLAAGRVDIDLDANEDIVCTFANTRDEAEVRLATQRAIRNFMVRRADSLLNAAPDLTRRARDRNSTSAGQFSADINGGNRMVSMGASLAGMRNYAAASTPQMPGGDVARSVDGGQADVWLAANYASVSDDRSGDAADSAFGVVQLGVDWAVDDRTVAGVMLQHDWADETTDEIAIRAGAVRGARVSGSGWMAGPYVVREIREGVWFDALALYGQSDNTVDPLGLYEDTFETDRYMLRMNLSGEWRSGDWRIRPGASLAHFQETQDAYTDSLGISIPEQTIAIGRLRAGPEIAYRYNTASGGWWEPSLTLTGVWDYNPAELLDVDGRLVGTGGLRADAKLGLHGQLAPGASIHLEMDVDGLGEADFEARGARVELRFSFN
ncbi:Ig-like domain-containing protein [Maricaulis sp.]|uniref:Ig-like domain-containing protein n=1 Tax=Maricaulis sp. TaxID=1486257 RepID=UPI002B2660FC|nr:Ig-like domain-containing protein [Maricaulis sp.]